VGVLSGRNALGSRIWIVGMVRSWVLVGFDSCWGVAECGKTSSPHADQKCSCQRCGVKPTHNPPDRRRPQHTPHPTPNKNTPPTPTNQKQKKKKNKKKTHPKTNKKKTPPNHPTPHTHKPAPTTHQNTTQQHPHQSPRGPDPPAQTKGGTPPAPERAHSHPAGGPPTSTNAPRNTATRRTHTPAHNGHRGREGAGPPRTPQARHQGGASRQGRRSEDRHEQSGSCPRGKPDYSYQAI